jgi:hypothetical protein
MVTTFRFRHEAIDDAGDIAEAPRFRWQDVTGTRIAAATHRKLRGLAAVFSDPAATEHEKANAERLKARLEEQLPQEPAASAPAPSEPVPGTSWTRIMFRLGRGVRDVKSPPLSPKGDWTDHAFRLGRMLRRGLKR